jgi:hypothetical protein
MRNNGMGWSRPTETFNEKWLRTGLSAMPPSHKAVLSCYGGPKILGQPRSGIKKREIEREREREVYTECTNLPDQPLPYGKQIPNMGEMHKIYMHICQILICARTRMNGMRT